MAKSTRPTRPVRAAFISGNRVRGPWRRWRAKRRPSGLELVADGGRTSATLDLAVDDRSLGAQSIVYVFGEARMRGGEGREGKRLHLLSGRLTLTNEPTNRSVRLAERGALAYEIVREIGSHH